MTKIIQMDLSDSKHVKTTVALMTFFLIFYTIIYRVLRRKINKSEEYVCRILTFVHGLFSSLISFHYVVAPALGFYRGNNICAAIYTLQYDKNHTMSSMCTIDDPYSHAYIF